MAVGSRPREQFVDRVRANPEALTKLLVWRETDPRFVPKSLRRSLQLEGVRVIQRQFTIELRVDYADNGKNDAMKKALTAAARHMLATASLLADNVKPQIAIFSDDFFSGHEEIGLLDDIIAQGKDQLEDAGVSNEEESISAELLSAVRS